MLWCDGLSETPATSARPVERRWPLRRPSSKQCWHRTGSDIGRRSLRACAGRRNRAERLLHVGVRRPPAIRLRGRQPSVHRYQRFSGAIRQVALDYCRRWASSSAGCLHRGSVHRRAASKLRTGGRIAFVVPAEIGHAPYATPLMEYLLANFGCVHVVAIREKIFPRLSETAGYCSPTTQVAARKVFGSRGSNGLLPAGCRRPCRS